MDEATLVEDLARTNLDLYRRVLELEDRDRHWMSRVAGLKLDNERLRAERGEG